MTREDRIAYACNLYLALWLRNRTLFVEVRETERFGVELVFSIGRRERTCLTAVYIPATYMQDLDYVTDVFIRALETLTNAWQRQSARLFDRWKVQACESV